MILQVCLFVFALCLVVAGATIATKYAGSLAERFRLSKYTVGFIIIAVISILPETFISIDAALKGIPSFGLGTLLGSNVADLTLVPALIVLYAGRHLSVEPKILKNRFIYPLLLLLPLVLGLDGYYSRVEGIALILAGSVFYYVAMKTGADASVPREKRLSVWKHGLFLFGGMVMLLIGSHFTVFSATNIASMLRINPVLIGMLVVGLGTTMPELFFSLKSVKKRDDSLAVGDILGTVLADATIVVGILALVSPFSFSRKIIYITGIFMAFASALLFSFLYSGRKLTKREAGLLALFWLLFVAAEFIANG